MNLDIELPDYGSFKNAAGQTIEFWIDKEDRTKCKILVDGKPLDGARLQSEWDEMYGKSVLDPKYSA